MHKLWTIIIAHCILTELPKESTEKRIRLLEHAQVLHPKVIEIKKKSYIKTKSNSTTKSPNYIWSDYTIILNNGQIARTIHNWNLTIDMMEDRHINVDFNEFIYFDLFSIVRNNPIFEWWWEKWKTNLWKIMYFW